MVTAVDRNIFLDVPIEDTAAMSEALRALDRALEQGRLVCSYICYAELAHRFQSKKKLDEFLFSLGCDVSPPSLESAYLAGHLHEAYRKRGGQRVRLLADFLIAADAQLKADRLLTRDGRFFGGEFPDLAAVDPASLLAL